MKASTIWSTTYQQSTNSKDISHSQLSIILFLFHTFACQSFISSLIRDPNKSDTVIYLFIYLFIFVHKRLSLRNRHNSPHPHCVKMPLLVMKFKYKFLRNDLIKIGRQGVFWEREKRENAWEGSTDVRRRVCARAGAGGSLLVDPC